MWSSFLYIPKEESFKSLRQLELEAYSLLISVFRAQGPLTQDKRKVLRNTSRILNITVDRHKAEVRRAVNDEKLNTIAYHTHGPKTSSEDWCQEGRRVLPMLQRISPQTLHPIITDTFACSSATQQNYQELSNPNFERKSEMLGKKLDTADHPESFNDDNSPAAEVSGEDQTALNVNFSLKDTPAMAPTGFYSPKKKDPERIAKIYPNKKIINKNQKLMIVSNTQTIPTNSILHKTVSVPFSKVTKLNLDKFKIVPSSTLPSSIHVSNLVSSDNVVTLKHNFITDKSGKKVIPLSQLQMLSNKLISKGGIKVLPLNSKIFGKNITMTRITPGQGLRALTPFSLAPTSKEQETLIDDNKDIKDKICDEDESLKEKLNIEEVSSKNLKAEDCENKEFMGKGTETEEFRTKEIDDQYSKPDGGNEEMRAEVTESEHFGTEEIDKEDFKKGETEHETLNDNKDKSCKNDDDLAALMDIDSSEFIEPEMKGPILVKKDF